MYCKNKLLIIYLIMKKIFFIIIFFLFFNSKHALSIGSCTQISDYEVRSIIKVVNSYGYNFDFYDVQSCMNFSRRGYISFKSTNLDINFDMNPVAPAFLIRSTYGGKGLCIKTSRTYEVFNQNDCL